jgi:hypothetical protein
MDRPRIQQVPERQAPCVLCFVFGDTAPKTCCHVDHDLRGYVCMQDSAAVIFAEEALHDAGLSIPGDSILEGGQY